MGRVDQWDPLLLDASHGRGSSGCDRVVGIALVRGEMSQLCRRRPEGASVRADADAEVAVPIERLAVHEYRLDGPRVASHREAQAQVVEDGESIRVDVAPVREDRCPAQPVDVCEQRRGGLAATLDDDRGIEGWESQAAVPVLDDEDGVRAVGRFVRVADGPRVVAPAAVGERGVSGRRRSGARPQGVGVPARARRVRRGRAAARRVWLATWSACRAPGVGVRSRRRRRRAGPALARTAAGRR